MSKYVDMIGWDDCPHLQPPHITNEELDELSADMLPHQRQARRTGRPSLGAGAVYPVNEDNIFIDPFPIPDYFNRGWAMDVGWNRTAAIFGAQDPDTDIVYLTHEYYVGEAQPLNHAHGIKVMLPWVELAGGIDPAAENSNQKDGTKLKQEYEDLGLMLVLANNKVAAGIHKTLTMLQGGELKVFNTLTYWRKEFRLYRRNDKGKIIKENDHLMDCTRYLLATPGLFTSRPIQQAGRKNHGEW
jgi:hypothetical protein